MRHAATARTTLLGACTAAVVLLALAPGSIAAARSADVVPESAATVRVRAFPPAVLIGTAAKDEDADGPQAGKSAELRLDSEEDFEALSERMPWVVGLIFLVVGSIFLTPIVLLVGIIWYKLRKARLQNEAMLALAEKGVVPPAQAAEALAAGASPASVAPQIHQQALVVRKRTVGSDLRKGVILSTLGLALSFYELTSTGGPSWIGLVLLFLGVGYVTLWWLEGRHLDQATRTGGDSGQAGTSGS